MQTAFDKAHEFTARWEGGYVDNPNDPGGATNYGISLAFLRSQAKSDADINKDGSIDKKDIKALTKEDAKRLLKKCFWDVLDLDRLVDAGKPRMAAVLYDTAMNMGAAFARKMGQKAVKTVADGIWGAKTWEAFKAADDFASAMEMCRIRKERYAQIVAGKTSLKVFLKGWNNRVTSLERFLQAW